MLGSFPPIHCGATTARLSIQQIKRTSWSQPLQIVGRHIETPLPEREHGDFRFKTQVGRLASDWKNVVCRWIRQVWSGFSVAWLETIVIFKVPDCYDMSCGS